MRAAKIEITQSTWCAEDEIRWVQWRVRERKALGSGKHADAAWRLKGKLKLREYQVWLLRKPSGLLDLSIGERFEFFEFLQTRELSDEPASLALPLTFQEIGDLLFPEVDDPGACKKRAADAYDRVESEFGRGEHKRKLKIDLSGPGHYW